MKGPFQGRLRLVDDLVHESHYSILIFSFLVLTAARRFRVRVISMARLFCELQPDPRWQISLAASACPETNSTGTGGAKYYI